MGVGFRILRRTSGLEIVHVTSPHESHRFALLKGVGKLSQRFLNATLAEKREHASGPNRQYSRVSQNVSR